MKKKLLFVYDYMMVGGTTTALLSMLNNLDREKYDIDLLLYRKGGEFFNQIPDFVNVLDEACVKSPLEKQKKLLLSLFNGQLFKAFYYFFKNKTYKSKSLKRTIWQSTEIAHAAISRKLNTPYDVVIGYIESWGAHYAVSNKVSARKRVIWIHLDCEKSYLIPELDKKMYQKADHIITVSRECNDNLIKRLPQHKEKISFIENIVEPESIRLKSAEPIDFQPDNNKFNIITVCRVNYNHKGLDRMLNAMIRLKKENLLKNIVWYIIGDGETKSEMEMIVNQEGLQKNVFFLGKKSNPFPFIKKADLFLLPSRFEGKPIAVTEAQILGVPCVVTKYASAVEQIADGFDGFILENNDNSVYEFLKNLNANAYNFDSIKKILETKDFSDKKIIQKIDKILE